MTGMVALRATFFKGILLDLLSWWLLLSPKHSNNMDIKPIAVNYVYLV